MISGRIAPRFLAEAKFVSGVNVGAVYNPNQKSAQEFGLKYEVDVYYNCRILKTLLHIFYLSFLLNEVVLSLQDSFSI